MSSTRDPEREPLLYDSDPDVTPSPLPKSPAMSDKGAEETGGRKNNSRLLLVSFLSLVFVGLGNKIFAKLQTLPMTNYPLWLSLYSVFMYIPLSYMYVLPMIKWGTKITKEQRAVPEKNFLVMGALDSIAGIMVVFATNYLPGALTVLLPQSAILFSMIISYFLMKARYRPSQIIGALIVVGGLIVVLLPMFLQNQPSDSKSKAQPSWELPVWSMVMVLSCIPMTLSSVFKEKALGEVELDPIYLNAKIANWQFIIGLVLLVPSAYASGNTAQQVPGIIKNGTLCYAGINSIDNTTALALGLPAPDDCHSAPLFVNLYLLFNLGYNVCILLVIAYSNSNLMWLAMTIMVPFSNIAFSLDFVPGHQPMKNTDIIGLVVIMLGLIMYRFFEVIAEAIRKKWGMAQVAAAITEPRPGGNLRLRGDALEAAQYFYDYHSQKRLLERHPESIRGSYLSRLGFRFSGSGAGSSTLHAYETRGGNGLL